MAEVESGETIRCENITVIVERFQPLPETGSCVGFARVSFRTSVGTISIDNFRLMKGKKNGMWVAPPSHKKGDKFYDDVLVDGDLAKLMVEVIKHAYSAVQRDKDSPEEDDDLYP